ncbi:C39 family peptidase [Streptomyces sp. NPDC002962]|uniref:C39 family peptidase n=1 Tax=Streptomyces sp. NPDC002962 TaxID=3364674 RepID=UPI0036894577
MVTQYATWDLIGPIAYQGYDPVNDPGWVKTGAPSPAFYARWCRHLCGIACLRMVLLHRDGRAPDLFTLLTGARNAGAYVREADGTVKGLIYAPFVEYAAHTHRLPGAVHGDLDLDGLVALLDAGHTVMASVSKEIRRPEHKPERRGGHLVLAIGRRGGEIFFRNPSGHTDAARKAAVSLDRFDAFFGGRGLSLDTRRTVRRTPDLSAGRRPVASRPTT